MAGAPKASGRAGALALYRTARAAIRRVLRAAVGTCGAADWKRALKQVAPWAEPGTLPDPATDMVADVALFEPNQRGRRAYDRFLAEGAGRLDAPDQALARMMAGARFSLFRVVGRHPVAGLWLDDLLEEGARFRLMDEALEGTARAGIVVGMRVFDAGPFRAGFGIAVLPDAETIALCRAARGGRVFRHPLAATLYGDALRAVAPPEAVLERMRELLEGLHRLASARPEPGRSRAGPAAPRGRKPPRRGT